MHHGWLLIIMNSNITLSVVCLHSAKPPVFGPCKLLDFELEMVGPLKCPN